MLTVSPGDLEAASWPMLWTTSWPVSQSPAGNSGDLPKAYEKELTEVRTVTRGPAKRAGSLLILRKEEARLQAWWCNSVLVLTIS